MQGSREKEGVRENGILLNVANEEFYRFKFYSAALKMDLFLCV